MPYVVLVGDKGFIKQGRVDRHPTIYHHPSSYKKAIEFFEIRYPEHKGQCVPKRWKRGELTDV